MNRSRILVLCLGLGLGFALAACGLDPNSPVEPGSKNGGNPAQACQDLENTLAACQPSLAGALQCQAYDGYPCDLGPYFDCVNDAYGACSGGTFPDYDPLTLSDCTLLAQCQ